MSGCPQKGSHGKNECLRIPLGRSEIDYIPVSNTRPSPKRAPVPAPQAAWHVKEVEENAARRDLECLLSQPTKTSGERLGAVLRQIQRAQFHERGGLRCPGEPHANAGIENHLHVFDGLLEFRSDPIRSFAQQRGTGIFGKRDVGLNAKQRHGQILAWGAAGDKRRSTSMAVGDPTFFPLLLG